MSSFHDTAAATGPGVVIGRKGTLGKVFYLARDYWPHDTTLWVKDFKGNDPRFVYYFMTGVDVSWLDAGSANPTLNRNHLHPLAVVWPPLPEQQAIAEVLGALDDKIAANTKLVGIADQLAASVTLRAISMEVRIELREIARVTMGSSPRGEYLNESGDGAVFYQGVRDFGVRTPTRRVWTLDSPRLAEPGDTLLSVRAPVGRVNVADERICIGRGIASIRSRVGYPWTIFNLLKSLPEMWAPFDAEGTIFSSINRSDLEKLQVPTVAESEAKPLEERLSTIEASIASALAENRTLAATRDALLPQLMSGKLRVRDAEQLASGVL